MDKYYFSLDVIIHHSKKKKTNPQKTIEVFFSPINLVGDLVLQQHCKIYFV